jgi:hypothetical protein
MTLPISRFSTDIRITPDLPVASPERAKVFCSAEQRRALASGGVESGLSVSARLRATSLNIKPYGELQLGEITEISEPARPFSRAIKLEGLDKHDPVLTSTVRDMLRTLWAIVVSRAIQTEFPLRRTAVSVFRDPEEEHPRALLRLSVKANAAQAIAFWDSLEKDLQDWLNGLHENYRLTFLRTISLRVHWSNI